MVDTIFHLFEFLDHSEDEGVAFRFLLKACKDQQLFINKASSGIHLVLPIINSKLNSSASRFKGLLLLKTLLPQFPADVIEENAVSWMQQCLKPTEAGENKQEVLDTTYQVLYTLLEMSEKFPEMRRPVSANIVPKIIENFQKISLDEPSLSALKCIELLMMKYGPSCGQQKNALEKCLFQYIDCQDSCISDRLARCVANLPLLGGGGSLGANHVNRWTQDHQKLCATLHDILDQLFCDIREIPNKYSCMTGEKLALPRIAEFSSLLRVCCLVTRFINISKCLQEMLHSEFPLDKALDLSAIMGIACRALAVNSRTIGKKVSNDITLTSVLLPEIHVAVFDLINSLITCCRDVLVTYDSIICQLVLQTLKWTSNKNWVCGVRKPYGCLRKAAYETLIHWLQISKTSGWLEIYADQLVPLLIEDIWFEKESVTLIVNTNRGKKKKPKSSGEENLREMNGRDFNKLMPVEVANKSVCTAALQLLQWILHSSSIVMKPTIHKTLQEKTVRLLLNLQNNMQPQDWPAPFAEGSCRVELYQLLYTLSTEPHPVWPPPTQHALQILSAGMADIDSMVSAFCTKAHAAFEKVIHPPAGTLQFPINLEEMVESTKFNKQNSAVPLDELSNASNGEDTRCVNSVKKDISSGTMDTGSTRMETSSPRIDTGCSIRIEPDSVRTISNEKDTQSKQPAQQKELRNEAKEKVSASEKQEVLYDEKVKNGNKNRVGSVSDEEMESENDVTLLSDDSDYSEKKINKKQTILNKYPCDIEDDGLDGEEEEEEEEMEEEEEEMEEEEEEEYDDEDEDVVVIGESDAEDKNVTQIKPSFKLVEKMKNGMPRQEVVQTTSAKDIEHKMTEEQVALKLVTDFSRSHNRGVKSNRTVDPLEGTDMQIQQLEEDNIDKDAVQTKTREEYQTLHGLEYDEDDGDYGSDDSIVDDYDEHDTSDRGEEDEKQEPVKKRAKLDSTDSVNLISKTEVTDDTEINMEQTEQQINGVESGPEEATEEEMLQSFVDAVPE